MRCWFLVGDQKNQRNQEERGKQNAGEELLGPRWLRRGAGRDGGVGGGAFGVVRRSLGGGGGHFGGGGGGGGERGVKCSWGKLVIYSSIVEAHGWIRWALSWNFVRIQKMNNFWVLNKYLYDVFICFYIFVFFFLIIYIFVFCTL